jgi:6-pyruvoyltetrahydropterin/6-carboxytetrahydropterin synthase
MEITKIFRFEASHSVKDAYTGRCDRMRGGLHGHSYVLELTLEGGPRSDGMVIDFSLVKEKYNHIIDAFDHSFIVNSDDKVMVKLAPYISSRFIFFPHNPTAENMAQYFFDYISKNLRLEFSGIILSEITVWETVTGKATCVRESLADTPTLVVSADICSKWKPHELDIFTHSNGVTLTPFQLITDLDLQVIESENTLKIIASLDKNCK